MSYEGTVENGVVVLPTDVHLAEGTKVRVEPLPKPVPATESKDDSSVFDRLQRFVGIVDGMPPDLAENHDHYIHGAPKHRKG